ncbi:MAG: hypothetical protein JW939_01360, partial [Candidatus Thermoplasmatota archaeon]|nr:hypothetical protein [Candidatus Thermoplasmatota archaeon]
IGPAKEKALLELGKRKSMELEAMRPGLKEVLEAIPRMSQRTISSLLGSGYDSFESFSDKTEDDLRQVRGVGPKMAGEIMKAVRAYFETYHPAEEAATPLVEEATAEVEPEETEAVDKDERSLVQRVIDAISGFFGGRKDSSSEEAEKGPSEEKEEPQEVPGQEGPEPDQVRDDEHEDGEAQKEVSDTEPSHKEEMMAESSEDKIDGEKEDGEQVKGSEEEQVPPQKKGFMERIKEMIFGKGREGEAEKSETSIEEASAVPVEVATAEETPVEGTVEEEEIEKPAGEEQTDETPSVEEMKEVEKKEYTAFEEVPGISKKTAEALRNAGYLSIEELMEAVPEDLMMVEGIGRITAEKICRSLKG